MDHLETADEFHARVAAGTDDEGRLPVAIELMPGWEENLPEVPDDVRRVNAAHVARRLVERVGGDGPAWEA